MYTVEENNDKCGMPFKVNDCLIRKLYYQQNDSF